MRRTRIQQEGMEARQPNTLDKVAADIRVLGAVGDSCTEVVHEGQEVLEVVRGHHRAWVVPRPVDDVHGQTDLQQELVR